MQLRTTTGSPLVVLSAGVHNFNGGPDFLQARVKIGDELWVGNVEIHIRSSDWLKHGHQTDKHYHTVVLHVVFEDDEPVHLHQAGDLPVFVMRPYMHHGQWSSYQQWMQHGRGIPCHTRVSEVDATLWLSFIDALLVERLEQKSQVVLHQLQRCRGDWNEVYYRLVARHFGGKVNADTMELIAERVPFHLVLKLRSDPFQLMALFYGVAGMLQSDFSDEFARELKVEFLFLKTKYQLPEPQIYHWQFFGLRPAGFPTVRIAQLVDFLSKGMGWMDQILELADVADLKKLFRCQAHAYWNTHTQFDRPRAKSLEGANGLAVGNDFIEGLLINVVSVVLFAYGRQRDDGFCLQRAMTILESIETENNKITRAWERLGVASKHAGDAQALIQLNNQYCEKKRCLHCRVGVYLLKGLQDSPATVR